VRSLQKKKKKKKKKKGKQFMKGGIHHKTEPGEKRGRKETGEEKDALRGVEGETGIKKKVPLRNV